MNLKELIKEVERLKWQEGKGVASGSDRATAHNCLWGIKQTVESYENDLNLDRRTMTTDKIMQRQKLKKLLELK